MDAPNTYNSGGPTTTGREPFETPYGDNTQSNTGAGTGTGVGTGANQPTTGQYGEIGREGNVGVVGGEGHHHHHHHKHHEGQTTGVPGGQKTHGADHVHDEFCGHERSGLGAAGQSYGADHVHDNDCGHLPKDGLGKEGNIGFDRTTRVGDLEQNMSNYETTGSRGPTTEGAAGTDRFDVDRSSSGAPGYGNESYIEQPGQTGQKSSAVEGVRSAFTTSDKEFTNRGETGTGAYQDTDRTFNSNTSGPGGNSALTGREGNFEKNPVSGVTGGTDTSNTGSGVTGNSSVRNDVNAAKHDETSEGGLMGKIKHALGK
ncbi:hypothetical protein P7C73_g5720, partial [Tremellales sp. Uapishka_1]